MAYKKKSKQEYAEDRKKKLEDITDKLESGIKELMSGTAFQDYLRCMSKFHNYSLNNTILIAMQCPSASLVAGYESWKRNFNRQVKSGEKGIKIIAPAPYKKKETRDVLDSNGKPVYEKDGNKKKETVEITIPAFKVISVFDYQQTEGQDLPSIGVDELSGKVDGYKDLIDGLKHIAPVPVEMTQITSGAKGYFSPGEQKICVQEGMSEVQTLKTLIHEISHSMLHDKDHVRVEGLKESAKKTRNVKEVEAEAVAYCVTQALSQILGSEIDTSEYSFAYIAGWSQDKELSELKESLETIRVTSDLIITGIENYLEERANQKEVAMELADEQSKECSGKSFQTQLKNAKEELSKREPHSSSKTNQKHKEGRNV